MNPDRLEERLRDLGFENDEQGFENRWQAEAFSHVVEVTLPRGQLIRALPPPHLLATKLEAFQSRKQFDFYGSRDWGDIVTLIDGREELPGEMAQSPKMVRAYVSERLREVSEHRDFDPGVEGALPSSPESRDRVDRVLMPRIRRLIGD